MKKTLIILICLAVLGSFAAGCGAPAGSGEKLSIAVTIFPEYDWVMQILGENANRADVTLLLDNGVDLHSYQPTADDIVKISACDLFIYVGGESDEWVNDVLKEASNKDMIVVSLLEALGESVKEEEVREGMEEDDHAHGGEEDDHEHEEEEKEYDEHVWLSLKNAAKLCGIIAGKLGEIDVSRKDAYTANANAYIEKLNALDAKYQEAAKSGRTKTLLFGDRFPFRYLTDDCGLDYYAAFPGCSAESEASFETILFLANKADELGLKAIMQIESSDGRIAGTVRDATSGKDQKILTLDSMQSTTAADVRNGVSYLSVMEKNLEVLREALQ